MFGLDVFAFCVYPFGKKSLSDPQKSKLVPFKIVIDMGVLARGYIYAFMCLPACICLDVRRVELCLG